MDLSIWFSNGFAFGWSQFEAVDWAVVPMHIYWKELSGGYFNLITYLLNLLTMKELKPTTVAVFIIFSLSSPLFFAIGLGKDDLSSSKIISAILIFVGVYMVTQEVKNSVHFLSVQSHFSF
jgi:drug/metabolite transporter (DMT)-like permease